MCTACLRKQLCWKDAWGLEIEFRAQAYPTLLCCCCCCCANGAFSHIKMSTLCVEAQWKAQLGHSLCLAFLFSFRTGGCCQYVPWFVLGCPAFSSLGRCMQVDVGINLWREIVGVLDVGASPSRLCSAFSVSLSQRNLGLPRYFLAFLLCLQQPHDTPILSSCFLPTWQ